MRPIKYEELIPQAAEFTLRSTGMSYRLRPVNIEDRGWIGDTFGADLEDIFKQIRVKEIARIAFHQLSDEDKKSFLAQDVKFIDEEGAEKSMRLGGLNLFYRLIQGNDEVTSILTALLHTIGISEPLINEMAADVDKEQAEKKSLESSGTMTGEKSLTASPASTAGRLTKSES